MTNANTFFKDRRPAAILKHGILRRYLYPFVSKTGKYARDHRVVYLDGYAGPGTYSDGAPGSPALAEETAQNLASSRNLECIFVEQNDEMYQRLCELLKPFDNAKTYHGSLDSKLDTVLELVDDAPLFAFLDPFGLPIRFNDLVDKLLQRPEKLGAKTEVLLNFSVRGVQRNAGHLTSAKTYAAKQALIKRTDERLGGPWWQDIWRDEPEQRDDLILRGYVQRLSEAAGGRWGRWTIPVANHVDGHTVYHLIFFTQHPDGMWTFNNALSKAMEEYHEFCYRGRLDIDPLEERKQRWTQEIYHNIERLLDDGSFVVQNRLDEVCGEALGYARDTHIRAAIKALHNDEKTLTTGVGDIQRMVVLPS